MSNPNNFLSYSLNLLMYNPSLRQEPRYEPAAVIPLKQESSLLDWLKANDRLIPRESRESEDKLEDDVEISELIEVDDHVYDDDDLHEIQED
ncbi:MAG: DUF3134 domain-containing protein [Xenococcaceae cyanobacterium]